MERRTVGVEEELLLVDSGTGVPRAVSGAVIRFARERTKDPAEPPEPELQREQLETSTSPCTDLSELADQLRMRRVTAAGAAQSMGAEAAALATSPIEGGPSLTPDRRYVRMAREYGLTADEQLTCGCHVHVGVSSAEEGVAVIDRVRPWLAPLLAMSANSPFWHDRDSGYDSYRHEVWGRWPSAGPTGIFGSEAAYRETVAAMLRTGALLDEGMIYFDARLSRRYPTVEIRIADVCLHAGDAVLIAALARALVDTAAAAWRAGEPPCPVRTELLRLASWRAGRSGLSDRLVHPLTSEPEPAGDVIEALLAHVGPALEEAGELGTVEGLLGELLRRGNGARVQRAAFHRAGDLTAVVADAVARTLES